MQVSRRQLYCLPREVPEQSWHKEGSGLIFLEKVLTAVVVPASGILLLLLLLLLLLRRRRGRGVGLGRAPARRPQRHHSAHAREGRAPLQALESRVHARRAVRIQRYTRQLSNEMLIPTDFASGNDPIYVKIFLKLRFHVSIASRLVFFSLKRQS